MTIEDRIALTLKAASDRIEVGESPLIGVRTLDPNPRRRTSRLVAFVGAFAAVIALAFAVLLARAGEREPQSDTTSTLSIINSGPLVWRTVHQLDENISVEVLVHGPSGWLAFTLNERQSQDLNSPPLLSSEDGVEWATLGSAGLPESVGVRGAIEYPEGYLAFGSYASSNYTVTTVDMPSNFPEPAIWISADGTDWTLVPLPLPLPEGTISDIVSYSVNGAAVVDGAVIVVGTEFDEDLPSGAGDFVVGTRVVVWISHDLENWRLVDGSVPTGVETVAGGPAGVLAAAYDGSGGAVIWRTSDGTTWDLVGSFPSLPGGPLYLQGGDSGYLFSLGPVVMFSTNGVAWSHLEGVDGLIGGGPGGFAAFGSTVQWSPDGQQWREVGPSDLLSQLVGIPTVGVEVGAMIVPGRGESGAGMLVVGTNH